LAFALGAAIRSAHLAGKSLALNHGCILEVPKTKEEGKMKKLILKLFAISLLLAALVAICLTCATTPERIPGNSLVPILPAGHRDISLNCYTAQLEPLPYLQ
jgi:hypothetical protein